MPVLFRLTNFSYFYDCTLGNFKNSNGRILSPLFFLLFIQKFWFFGDTHFAVGNWM